MHISVRQARFEACRNFGQQISIERRPSCDFGPQRVDHNGLNVEPISDGIDKTCIELRLREHTGDLLTSNRITHFCDPRDARGGSISKSNCTKSTKPEALLKVLICIVEYHELPMGFAEICLCGSNNCVDFGLARTRVVLIGVRIRRIDLGQLIGNQGQPLLAVFRCQPCMRINPVVRVIVMTMVIVSGLMRVVIVGVMRILIVTMRVLIMCMVVMVVCTVIIMALVVIMIVLFVPVIVVSMIFVGIVVVIILPMVIVVSPTKNHPLAELKPHRLRCRE